MSNDLVELESVVQAIDMAQERFVQVAPSNIIYEAEKGFAIQLLQNNQQLLKVAQSNKKSLMHAVANVAAIGLSLNPVKKQAYLIQRTISFKDDRGKKHFEARIFLEPSYMGLCDIATQSDSIDWVQADCVYNNDTFEYNGAGEKPTHKFNPFKPNDRGQFIGAYCVAKLPSGDYLTTMMSSDDIYSIRDRSEAWKAGEFGPWKTDFKEMAKKTVIRNAFKTWPKKDNRLELAVDLSNNNEGFEPIQTAPKLNEFTADQKAYFDGLIEKGEQLEMYVFTRTIDDSTFSNLYNSFEKGTKVKYKKIVDDMLKTGESIFLDLQTAIEDACSTGDDVAVNELAEDFSPELLSLIGDRINNESLQFMIELGYFR